MLTSALTSHIAGSGFLYSGHATRRCQQRRISPLALEWLLEFGRIQRSYGCDRYYFDKKARRKLKAQIGQAAYNIIKPPLNAYAVVSDSGQIVTAGWRH